MKKALIVSGALVLVSVTALVAAAVVGPPEIDPANVVLSMKVASPRVVTCPGEDAPDQYATTLGTWNGTETEVVPAESDYSLTGKLVYKANVTVNLSTHRGVMKGTATLSAQAAAGGPFLVVYQGPLTLVLQQVDQPNGLAYLGRGFLNAPTFSKNAKGKNAKDGGSVIANVEATFVAGGGSPFATMNGQFGDNGGLPAEPLVKDYSVVSTNKTCA